MKFCNIEKNSLNDFPEKLSCVIFTIGCNFFCPYCHNPQAILEGSPNPLSSKKILTFIEQRKKFYDGIVISGGEPTLNQELPLLCKEIKKMGYFVKLDTNGSRPDVINELLNMKIVDYVAMDIKTALTENSYKKFTNEPYVITSITKSIELIMEKASDYEFRTTCVYPFINHQTIKKISGKIKGAKCYTLQPFNQNTNSILNEKFFEKINPVISKKNILEFIKIAKPLVKHCKTTDLE